MYKVYESIEGKKATLVLETEDLEVARKYERDNIDPFTSIEIQTESGEIVEPDEDEKRFIIVDDCGSDFFTEEFTNEIRAVMTAEREWNHFSAHDKKRRNAYYVAYGTIDNHDVVKRYK